MSLISIKHKAFTLIELLVVVAIIGILAAVGVVAYNGYTGAAKTSATKSQHKKIVKFITTERQRCYLAPDGVHPTLGNYTNYLSNPTAWEAKMYCNYSNPLGSSLHNLFAKHFCYAKFYNFWDSSPMNPGGNRRCGVNYENNIGPNLKPDLGQSLISCLDSSNPYQCKVATQVKEGEIIIDILDLSE